MYLKKTLKKNYFQEKFNLASHQMIFLYQGGLSEKRGVEIVLKAFKNLKDPKKIVVFMGNGYLKEMVQSASNHYSNIFHLNAVPINILLDYTSSADVGLILYEINCLNHYYCLPNKFFEYTQAELPMIISNSYEMRMIIDKYKNGLIVEEDAEALKKVIESITWNDIENYKKSIPEMKKIYNWENQEKVLLKAYNSLL